MIKEILVVLLHELRLSLTSKRVILAAAIIILGAVLMSVGLIKLSRTEQATILTAAGRTAQMTMSTQEKGKLREELAEILGEKAEIVEYRLKTPLLLVIVFWLTSIFFPFLVAMLGYDSMAGEVKDGAIRFLLTRGRRSSILLGKYLAQCAWLLILLLLGLLAVALCGIVMLDDAAVLVWLRDSLVLTLFAWILSAAYLALVLAFSCMVRRPFAALMLSVVGLLAMGIWGVTPWKVACPNYYKLGLLGPPEMALKAVGVFVIMAVLMLLAAASLLRVRDL